jgi:hypothetical protein
MFVIVDERQKQIEVVLKGTLAEAQQHLTRLRNIDLRTGASGAGGAGRVLNLYELELLA